MYSPWLNILYNTRTIVELCGEKFGGHNSPFHSEFLTKYAESF